MLYASNGPISGCERWHGENRYQVCGNKTLIDAIILGYHNPYKYNNTGKIKLNESYQVCIVCIGISHIIFASSKFATKS